MPVLPDSDATAVAVPEPQEPRLYAVTGGRTAASRVLHIESLLVLGSTGSTHQLSAEARLVLAVCGQRSVAVAEIANALGQPVWAAKVLISDLLDIGALLLPTPTNLHPERDPQLLLRVVEGLRRA